MQTDRIVLAFISSLHFRIFLIADAEENIMNVSKIIGLFLHIQNPPKKFWHKDAKDILIAKS